MGVQFVAAKQWTKAELEQAIATAQAGYDADRMTANKEGSSYLSALQQAERQHDRWTASESAATQAWHTLTDLRQTYQQLFPPPKKVQPAARTWQDWNLADDRLPDENLWASDD